MMRDRRVQTLAENQVLIMRGLFDLLMHARKGDMNSEHFGKLAVQIAARSDELQDMIEREYFVSEVRFSPLGSKLTF